MPAQAAGLRGRDPHLLAVSLISAVVGSGLCSAAAGQEKPSYIYPQSTIGNVSIEGFLPDGRHYRAIVYLSGNFSTSYYAPSTHPQPEGRVSDGWTNDEQYFVLAEAALDSSKADEIELPTRKELEDAAFSGAPSRFRGRVIVVISALKGKAKSRAFMRKFDGKFASPQLRSLDEHLMDLCDKRVR